MTVEKPSLSGLAESPHEPELAAPFEILEPASVGCPLVFSSPHSGNVYPRRFLDGARLDSTALRRSEDAFVDHLFAGAVDLGAPLLRARFPRAYLDLNREPYELDPRMFDGRLPPFCNTRSLRVAGGLGTIARVVGEAQEIYTGRLSVEEGLGRIERLYKPYHRSLRNLLDRAQRMFGLAVLIDCHSMPSAAIPGVPQTPNQTTGEPEKKMKADFVVGDRYGTSCETSFVDLVEDELRKLGYIVQRNKPYAGGFITEHYGNPAAQCHAMQIEVNRSLYMDERGMQKIDRFAEVSADLKRVVAALVCLLGARRDGQRAAAE